MEVDQEPESYFVLALGVCDLLKCRPPRLYPSTLDLGSPGIPRQLGASVSDFDWETQEDLKGVDVGKRVDDRWC